MVYLGLVVQLASYISCLQSIYCNNYRISFNLNKVNEMNEWFELNTFII